MEATILLIIDHGMQQRQLNSMNINDSINDSGVNGGSGLNNGINDDNIIDDDDSINMQPTKFVSVNAEYLPSCFGNKIENLVKYRQPIRFIEFNENGDALNTLNTLNRLNPDQTNNNNNNNNNNSGDNNNGDSNGNNNKIDEDGNVINGDSNGGQDKQIEQIEQGQQGQQGQQNQQDVNKVDESVGGVNSGGVGTGVGVGVELLSLPKELWRLVDHLYKYGMDTEDIFLKQGPTKEISDIRECLDTGKEFSRYELHSVGEALVRFLESTNVAVFPSSLCDTFKSNSNMNITQWCRQALINLPLSHYNAFIYIVSFLREVLKHSQRNKLTPEKLACQFSIALMHKPIPKQVDALAKHKPFQILLHFLTNIESM